MKRSTLLALLTAVSLLTANAAQAAIIHFEVDLLGINENPATPSSGTGSATIDIDTVVRSMFIDLTFSGLSGLTTASHIHCCSAPSANAPVATQTPTFRRLSAGSDQRGLYEHFRHDAAHRPIARALSRTTAARPRPPSISSSPACSTGRPT